jgi:Outer membrane efflux protein
MKKVLWLGTLISLSSLAQTPVKTFEDLWSQFHQKSLSKQSLEEEKMAQSEAKARADRHWWPKAYVAGQWFSTNDPTQVFFNHLGQRSIGQNDFVFNNLNHPERKNFQTATLGLDMPLYEGGLKSQQVTMYEKLVRASELELKAKRTEEYSELGRHYGQLIIYHQQHAKLKDLKEELLKILKNYQVGAQSNPVGYSGVLGLKAVQNRMIGMLDEFELKIIQSKKWIQGKMNDESSWEVAPNQDIKEYFSKNLNPQSTQSYSTMLLAQELKASTLIEAKNMEKARFLPRVGLFAQSNLYQGQRDSSTSQVYGLYLMWEIFNNDSYGRLGEAAAKARSAEAKVAAYKQEEKIAMDQLNEAKSTLDRNLELLKETDALMLEQTQNAMKLFRSGLLSALQLAEVLNRRVDLIQQKNQAQIQSVEVHSKIYQLMN